MNMSSFFVEFCITLSALLVVIVIISIITLAMLTLRFKYSKQLKDKGTTHDLFYDSERYSFKVGFL